MSPPRQSKAVARLPASVRFGTESGGRTAVNAAVPLGRQRAGPSSHRDQEERKAGSKDRGQDCCEPDARVRNRDDQNGRNHPQPANALDRNVCHIDQRG